MQVSNIMLDRDSQEIKLYFKEHDYCVRTKITPSTYRMYCEFNNIEKLDVGEVVAVNINTIKWNSEFEKLVSL
jgi:hypothetical protein